MAYGIQTGGGAAGGAADALQAGISQGIGLYNAQADRDMRKQQLGQEAGFRQQEIGLQQQAGKRADIASRLDLNKYQHEANQRQMDALAAQGAYAQGKHDDTQASFIASQLDAIRQRDADLDEHSHLMVIDHGLDQTQNDIQAVKTGQVQLQDLPDNRASHVLATALAAPAIHGIDGDHHADVGNPDGRAPLNQAHDDFLTHSANGNHSAAAEAAFPLVAGHLSPHDQDHPDYAPGFNAGDHGMAPDDPNIQHAPIAQGYDIVGRKGAVLAAANSDPVIQQKVISADQNGATQQQQAALHAVSVLGGRQGVKKAAGPSDIEQQYEQNRQQAIAAGADPNAAHQQAVKTTVDQREELDKSAMRDFYLRTGRPIPDYLKEPESDRKARILEKAYTDAGMDKTQAKAKATQEAYNPELVTEGMRAQSAKDVEGMRAAAEKDVAGIRLQGMAGRGLQGTIAQIDDMVANGEIEPAVAVQMKKDAVNSNVHRYDKNKPQTGAVTDQALHAQAVQAAKASVLADPSKDVGAETTRLFDQFKADRDKPAPTAPGAAPAVPALPPQAVAALKEGHVTKFGNGQQWTLRGGKPVQVQ